MKFTVKLPGDDEAKRPASEVEEATPAHPDPEGPLLKRRPRMSLPEPVEPELAEELGEATTYDETFDEEDLFDGSVEMDEEESFIGLEELHADDEDEAPTPADSIANPLLDDDQDDEPGSLAGLRSAPAPNAEQNLAVDDEWNPLLDDEEEADGETFDGLEWSFEDKNGVAGGEKEGSYSDGAVEKPGAAVEEVVVKIPTRPDLSPKDKANLAKKAAREAEREAELAGQATPKKALDSNFDPKLTYEVAVDHQGREKKSPREPAQSEEKSTAEAGKMFRIVNDDGTEKWTARRAEGVAKGKLEGPDLKVFTNLNRKKKDVLSDDELRSAFAKRGRAGESRAERARKDRLANRAIFGDEQLQAGSRKRFTEKDRDTLRFVGMFKYANARHIARIFQVSEATMTKRLQALEKRGLMVKKDIYGARPLWYLTEGGLVCSGLEVPRVKEAGITYTMLPHQFVVNHTAGNLWGGGVNVLNLEDFPGKFRQRENGDYASGEALVSELEIQSSFSQIKVNHKADTYRPIVTGEREKQFRLWEQAGGIEFGPSPEQIAGNEYMWTLIPPVSLRLAYHVPDLVVKRPRAADGSPNSIAVEIELANKPYAAYERALQAYRFDSLLYGQVIWVVKSRGAARKLEEAARKVGLWDDERIDIVPIFTEDGVFKSKAEWTL